MGQIDQINWIIGRHEAINHMYDKYLPYKIHLELAVVAYNDFKYLLDDRELFYPHSAWGVTERSVCFLATWGHDLLEDCPTQCSYNDLKNVLGQEVADVIYAVTNEKGKKRSERANDKYYREMVEQKGAVFVKLCDRIANLQYSALTRSRMYDKYQEEMDGFISKIYTERFKDMFDYMRTIEPGGKKK